MAATGVARTASGAFLRVIKGDVEDWHLEVGNALAKRYSLQGWSVSIYQRDWALLRKTCGIKHPSEITFEDLEEECFQQKEAGYTITTRDSHIARVRSIYNSLRILKIIPEDYEPEKHLPKLRLPKYTPRPITDEQALHLMTNADEPYREWFMLACLQGLRAMEVATIRGDWLEKGPLLPDGLQIWSLRVFGKGNTELVIPAHPLIVELIQSKNTSGPLYGIQPHYLSKKVNAEMRRLGVETRNKNDRKNTSRISYHSCRHYFATTVYAASGKDLILTSQVMRHANPATTMRYADLASGDKAKVVNSLFQGQDFTAKLPQAT
jgi:integrase